MPTTNPEPSLLDESVHFFNRGMYAKAERLLQEAAEHSQYAAEAMHYLGLIQLNKGQVQDAFQYWEQSLGVKETFDTLSNVGYLHGRLGNMDSAYAYLEKAYNLRKERTEVAVEMANIRFRQGAIDECLSLLKPLLAIHPLDSNAYLLYASVQANNENYAEAESKLLKLLANDASHTEAILYLARLSHLQSQPEQAIGYYQQILSSLPDHTGVLQELGIYLLQMGRIEEGLTYLKRYNELKPGDIQTLVALGDGYAHMKQLPEARRYYTEALKIQPENIELKKRLEMLPAEKA